MQAHLSDAIAEAAERSEHGFGHAGFIENTFERYLDCGLLLVYPIPELRTTICVPGYNSKPSDVPDYLFSSSRPLAKVSFIFPMHCQILKDVLDSVQGMREQRDIDIRVLERLLTIACDRIRAGEVFRNLITNAMKFNDKEQRWVQIGFESRAVQGVSEESPGTRPVVLYVRDNGIGVRENYLDEIFQMFRHLHGRTRFGGGISAGFTIAKKIVERHGGAIRAESIFGEGTTFYFTLTKTATDTPVDAVHTTIPKTVKR